MAYMLKKLFVLLEERLVEHDESRKEVQAKLKETCSKITKDADSLKEKINEEISEDFNAREEEILGLIEKLNERKGGMAALVKKAKEELSKEWKYEIQHSESHEKSFVGSYKLEISSVKVEKELNSNNTESIVNALQEHFEKIRESKEAAEEKYAGIYNQRRKEAEELGKGVNGRLEEIFKAEDARIQRVVKMVKENIDSEDPDVVKELIRKSKLTLLKNQKYSLKEDSLDSYDLKVEKEASLKFIDFEERKPADLVPSFTEKGELSLSFTFFNGDEEEVLKDLDSSFEVEVKVWEKGLEEGTSKTFTKDFTLGNDGPVCFKSTFTASTTYCLKMRIVHQEMSTQWSDEAEFTTPEFKDLCVWKECPGYVYGSRKYSVDEKNPRIATKGGNYGDCTVIGNMPLPLNKVTSWSIKVLKSRDNNVFGIYIGIAPSGINQNINGNHEKYGWYLYCYNSELFSGPPHKYDGKEYGPRKRYRQYVHTGDNVGVVMDTTKGELSFVLSGVNLGVAYEGIPLDKPLVPCILLGKQGDSIELDVTEAKENVDSSILVPSGIKARSITWDSITFTWNAVEEASFYQIELDGSKSWDVTTTNTFTKVGLLPDTEHTFRVRVVKGNTVGRWSNVVKGRTMKTPEFKDCVWKECFDCVDEKRKYSVDEKSPRIATKIRYSLGCYCTIIGNMPLPLNKVTSWDIKILKSRKNDGSGIHVGVSPSDINQDEDKNYEKYGWYFNCYYSALISGPPHNYRGKEYCSKKQWGGGKYVHIGDSVGVVMDTTKGELSFVVNRVNLGVAYTGIPLDKPLVPCVILESKGDSVELVI